MECDYAKIFRKVLLGKKKKKTDHGEIFVSIGMSQ